MESATAARHEKYMQLALKEARAADRLGEVPVGAVIVHKDVVIARAHNDVQRRKVATAHAEIIALERAFLARGKKYLPDCTLYTTLEPCAMCAGACYWAQIGEIVFGATDHDRGYHVFSNKLIHPRTSVTGNIAAGESAAVLQSFFGRLRAADNDAAKE